MKELRARSRKEQLDQTYQLGAKLEKEADPELRAHYTQYLCVRTAGFMEKAVSLIYTEHVRRRSAPSVLSYASSRLSALRNPEMDRLLTVAGAFDPKWREDLEKFVEGERRDAWNSIMGNRHRIAHGDTVTLTYSRLHQYYERILEILDFVEAQCL